MKEVSLDLAKSVFQAHGGGRGSDKRVEIYQPGTKTAFQIGGADLVLVADGDIAQQRAARHP